MELKITNSEIIKHGVKINIRTNIKEFEETSIKYNKNIKRIPFGNVVQQDTTIFPGRVKFTFQDNSIEIMENKLIINGKSYEWKSIDGMAIYI